MAHHRDINRASSLLEGSQGWIIEYQPEAITDPNKKERGVVKRNVPIIIADSVIMRTLHVWVFHVVHILKNIKS